ncbi:MAG: MT-A70 family methyltransferase [Prolixibacteraceae bacterium]|jgi:N6-adenosine-specific RNA methylase IME4|nr:MT-A70 family methyltransferase [Prolixibacteraceae bacterium]
MTVSEDFLKYTKDRKFSTILADPPWQFQNRTGKMAPEHKRLSRYPTLSLEEIMEIPVQSAANETAHLYLWVPNALLAEGLKVMESWGFTYKTNLIWYKTRKDGGPDRRGVGFYFRNVTEIILFGVRGKDVRTLQPGRTQENIIVKQKREHSRKPDEQYALIEACSWGPFLEMFARGNRPGWYCWGNQADDYYPEWETYKNHSQNDKIRKLYPYEPLKEVQGKLLEPDQPKIKLK